MQLEQRRRTKIVCTIGPASRTPERLRGLIAQGMDVARINAAHGDRDSHARLIAAIREQATAAGRPVGILFDLQGPKIRIGDLEHPRVARAGDVLHLAVNRPPGAEELPTSYPLLDRDVAIGHRLLIDDGRISTEVVGVEPGLVRCRVNNEGKIGARKGINLPDSWVSAPAVSDKDRGDALFAVERGVDMLALSFVRRGADVEQLSGIVGAAVPVLAKIEKPQGLDHLEEILAVSWGVMVARGDLGVELPPEEVPMAQKHIIQRAQRWSRPVVTATQMLESMTRTPRPTRAEASDVANAVITDAVMLSAETASGGFPLQSTAMMARIVRFTESQHDHEHRHRRRSDRPLDAISHTVVDAGCDVAERIGARGILAFTSSGKTALLTAERRPGVPILAFSPSPRVRNRLSLVWGVEPYHIHQIPSTEALLAEMDAVLLRQGLANHDETFVVLMGGPDRPPRHTFGMMVHAVGRQPTAEYAGERDTDALS